MFGIVFFKCSWKFDVLWEKVHWFRNETVSSDSFLTFIGYRRKVYIYSADDVDDGDGNVWNCGFVDIPELSIW